MRFEFSLATQARTMKYETLTLRTILHSKDKKKRMQSTLADYVKEASKDKKDASQAFHKAVWDKIRPILA